MIAFFQGLFLFLIVFSLTSPVFSQAYKWTDKNGNISFSDTPPSDADWKKVEGLKEEKSEPPPSPPLLQHNRSPRNVEVLLYLKEWCPHSLRARAYLKSLGVHLTEYDVDKDKYRNEERTRKAGKGSGVPVIDVEGIIVKGFSPARIKAAVEKRRNL